MMRVGRKLLILHRRLLSRSLLMDALLLFCSFVYFLMPVSEFALTPENALFGVLILIVLIALNMRILQKNGGGSAFYLLMPCSRTQVLLVGLVAILVPFMAAVSLLVLALAHLDTPAGGPLSSQILSRYTHVLFVFFLIKILPLPTIVLAKRHPALVILYYFGVAIIGFVVLVPLRDAIGSFCKIPGAVFGFLFFVCVVALNARILNKAGV